jgi:hypothetical protein
MKKLARPSPGDFLTLLSDYIKYVRPDSPELRYHLLQARRAHCIRDLDFASRVLLYSHPKSAKAMIRRAAKQLAYITAILPAVREKLTRA